MAATTRLSTPCWWQWTCSGGHVGAAAGGGARRGAALAGLGAGRAARAHQCVALRPSAGTVTWMSTLQARSAYTFCRAPRACCTSAPARLGRARRCQQCACAALLRQVWRMCGPGACSARLTTEADLSSGAVAVKQQRSQYLCDRPRLCDPHQSSQQQKEGDLFVTSGTLAGRQAVLLRATRSLRLHAASHKHSWRLAPGRPAAAPTPHCLHGPRAGAAPASAPAAATPESSRARRGTTRCRAPPAPLAAASRCAMRGRRVPPPRPRPRRWPPAPRPPAPAARGRGHRAEARASCC